MILTALEKGGFVENEIAKLWIAVILLSLALGYLGLRVFMLDNSDDA